jgi:hypothetical protein
MPKRTCAFCARRSGLAMRAGMVANLAAGVCCIAFACSVQFPIQTLSAVGMLMMGILSVVSTLAGLVGSWHYRVCLTVYLYMGGLSTFGQMILVICMHTNFDGVLNDLDTQAADEKYSRAAITKVGGQGGRRVAGAAGAAGGARGCRGCSGRRRSRPARAQARPGAAAARGWLCWRDLLKSLPTTALAPDRRPPTAAAARRCWPPPSG